MTGATVPTDGLLPCVCWCGKVIRKIPKSDVFSGRTFSCGRPNCKEA